MAEKQTRVSLYTELRNQIDKMDTYSFDDPNRNAIYSSSLPLIHEEAMSDDEIKTEHIKKNTLSISIDELIKQHDEYTSPIERKELNKKYKEVKKKRKTSRSLFNSLVNKGWIYILCGIVVVIVVIVICLLVGGII